MATAAVVAASCLPEPHDLVGRPCDTEHACGDEGLVCCRGTCQPASGAALCNEPETPDGGVDGGHGDGGDGGDGGVDGGGIGDGGPPDGGASDGGTGTDGGCPPNLLTTGGFEQASDIQDYVERLSGKASWSTTYVHSGTGALHVGKDPANSDPTFGVQLRDTVLTSLEIGPTYCISAWTHRTNTNAELFLEFTTHHTGASSEQTERIPWTLINDEWHLFVAKSNVTAQYDRSIHFRILAPYADGGVFSVDDARIWKSPDGTCPERCAR
jgi:hypothetical protein